MGTIKIDGYSDYIERYESVFLRGAVTDAASKKALYQGARIITDAISVSLDRVQSNKATGQLLESLGISKMRLNKAGNWSTKVGFSGYDDKGTPNPVKARALNSGTSRGEKKTQFLDSAVRKNRKAAEKAMSGAYDLELFKVTENL